MRINSMIEKEKVPEGKRSVRDNVWGNCNAYVGGKFWKTLGPSYSVGIEEEKAAWLSGKDDETE